MFELKFGAAEAADRGTDWLQFWSSIVGSLAWPIAAAFIAFLFRGQIARLLAKIRKLTWGDKSAEFDIPKALDKLEENARAVGPPVRQGELIRQLPNDERFRKLLELSPAAAIIGAWGPLQAHIDELVAPVADTPDGRLTILAALRTLASDGRVPVHTYNVISELYRLRNAAVHNDAAVTITDALRFKEIVDRVMEQLAAIMP